MDFDRACPSGNHMVDGDDDDYSDLEVGDTVQDIKLGTFWEVTEIDDGIITMVPSEEQELMITEKDIQNNFIRS